MYIVVCIFLFCQAIWAHTLEMMTDMSWFLRLFSFKCKEKFAMVTLRILRREAMDCNSWVEKTKDVLSPFETENILRYLNIKSAFGNPWIIGIFLVILVVGIIKRSKFIILTLFSIVGLLLLMQYTFPQAGQETSLSTLAPFLLGGMLIAGVIIYFTFVKSD